MTRKDYITIAQAVCDGAFIECKTPAEVHANTATRSKIAYQLANVFALDNPRFDRERFLRACGVSNRVIHLASKENAAAGRPFKTPADIELAQHHDIEVRDAITAVMNGATEIKV